jgi:hypothetical protein
MLAGPAAAIVVHHDASADPRGLLVDLAPHRGHHPAWLVAGNDRALELAKPKRRGFSAGRTVEFEIAAAHPGRFDFDDDIMGPWRRIGKFGDLQFAFTKKNHSTHRKTLHSGSTSKSWRDWSRGDLSTWAAAAEHETTIS